MSADEKTRQQVSAQNAVSCSGIEESEPHEARRLEPQSLYILIIDDEAALAKSLCRFFRRIGWYADFATTTKEGYARALSGHYDVLVVDQQLGLEKSGLDVIRRLRQDGCDRVIVVYTGVGVSVSEAEEALWAGADDHVLKEPDVTQLHRRIRMAWARHRSAAARPRPPVHSAFVHGHDTVLRYGPLSMDLRTSRVYVRGERNRAVHDEPYELLRHLMVHAERMVPWAEIEDDVLEAKLSDAGRYSLRHRLRKALGNEATMIVTEPGAVGLFLGECAPIRTSQK